MMNLRRLAWATGIPALLLLGGVAWSHNAICDCYDNEDGSITCEGGFSDGGKATGIPLRIVDGTGKVLVEGKMSENSDFTFPKPAVDFRVEFDAGEGHMVTIDGRDIQP